MTDHTTSVTEQELQAAEAEVRRLKPQFVAARKSARADNWRASVIRGDIGRDTFLLRFRAIRKQYELWPVGVILVIPFAGGSLFFVAACLFELTSLWTVFAVIAGVVVSLIACFHLLWIPPSDAIQERLPELKNELTLAVRTSQKSNECLERVKLPYFEAKRLHRQLKAKLAAHQRERAQREREQKKKAESAHQRRLKSIEYQRQELLQSNWKAMRSVEFEEFLREVFQALGYEVNTTPVTGDQGVDLIVQDTDHRIAVQVKGYFHSVGNEAVQQAHTGMVYYRCQACAVITNSRFSSAAQKLASSVGCILVDEDRMHDFIMGRLRL